MTTARITHATPGALYAHTQNRDWESDSAIPEIFRNKNCQDIAYQLVHSDAGQKTNVRIVVVVTVIVVVAVATAVVVAVVLVLLLLVHRYPGQKKRFVALVCFIVVAVDGVDDVAVVHSNKGQKQMEERRMLFSLRAMLLL